MPDIQAWYAANRAPHYFIALVRLFFLAIPVCPIRAIAQSPTTAIIHRHISMRILKAAVAYFALVFGAGFALGTIRILWIVPRLGTRMAELMEAPIMLVITIVVARLVVRRLAVPPKPSSRLGMGCIALFLLLLAEFSLVLYLRGMSINDYIASRDPISGTVYYGELGILAIIPYFIDRGRE
jgi:hypothetical protein